MTEKVQQFEKTYDIVEQASSYFIRFLLQVRFDKVLFIDISLNNLQDYLKIRFS